jgi:L-lactate dehydrogenase complex protein LldG
MTVRDETTARAEILERIAGALRDHPKRPDVPRDYRTTDLPAVDIVDRFAERVADYRAVVRRTRSDDVAATITAALRDQGSRRIVVPDGVPTDWLGAVASDVVGDEPPLSHAELDAVDAVITGCAVAIAETGTIVLDAGPGQGRRALSLLPDHHVCVVRSSQIVGDVPQALGRLDPRRPLTWISGPSATSDIELDRVEGVHGPRNLDVVIVDDV